MHLSCVYEGQDTQCEDWPCDDDELLEIMAQKNLLTSSRAQRYGVHQGSVLRRIDSIMREFVCSIKDTARSIRRKQQTKLKQGRRGVSPRYPFIWRCCQEGLRLSSDQGTKMSLFQGQNHLTYASFSWGSSSITSFGLACSPKKPALRFSLSL